MIDETAAQIEAMQTHSSSAVAVQAAQALTELTDREYTTTEEFVRDVEQNANALRRANPSHASLENALRRIIDAVVDVKHEDVATAKTALTQTIQAVVDDIETNKTAAASAAAELLDDGDTVLTHDFSTTVLEAIEEAVADGAYLDVYVTEARPRFVGRKTARRLGAMDRVDATLIVDSAAGHYLAECDRVLTGITCLVDETLHNRVGTYPLAATAANSDVTMSIVGSSAKVIDAGFAFENDFRPEREVLLEPTEGFAVGNPAYDATPIDLIDEIITDDGIERP